MSQTAVNSVAQHTLLGTAAAWWGLGGTVAFLSIVCVRLFPFVTGMGQVEVGRLHWLLLILNMAFMAYSEGYRGFQKHFSPRVAERSAALRSDPRALRCVLAPLYVMGFFAAPRRVLFTVYGITAGVAVLVRIVRALDQPWRGIIDGGVVVGLAWGAVATLYLGARALRSENTI